ncbi:MAG: tetratricopeptide repeat protein [Candidatus Zixiibacteriota bacterium]|nr:MAG: tetratricopeptide repeat protein [candidate division Zixibacteria bacterium]
MKNLVFTAFAIIGMTSIALAGPADEALDKAQALFDKGDFQDAATTAAEGLKTDPEHFKLLRISGQIQLELGQHGQALEFFEKALGQKSKDIETLYGAGMSALKIGEYNKAAEYFQRGLDRKKQARFYYGLGMAQTELGNYSEADLNLRKAIDKEETVAEYHLALAEENYRYKVYPIAINEFKKAVELDSTLEKTVPDLYYKIGESYLNLQNILQAIFYYKKGLELFPDDIVAWKKLARICEVANKPADAVYCIENVVRIAPDDGEWWFKLAGNYLNIKNREKATESYEKAIGLDYNVAESFGQLALLYADLDQYEKAWDAYTRYEATFGPPDSTLYWYEKGKVGIKLGSKNMAFFDSALYAFKKAIELDSTFSSSYEYAGLAYYFKRQYSNAIPYFKKKIELDSTSVNSLRNLAFCLLKEERYVEAAAMLEKALVVKAEDIQMRTMLGKIYSFNKKYDEAVQHFEILLNDYSESLNDSIRCLIYPDLGLSYLSDGKCTKATPVLLKAEQCNPNDISVLLNIATSYHTCNLIKEANTYYKKVLRIDPNNKDATRGNLETTIQGQE